MRQSLSRRRKLNDSFHDGDPVVRHRHGYNARTLTRIMDFLTRRNFLERSAALAAGGLIVGDFCGVCSTVKTEPHMEFPRAPRDRIAITSYPFRAFIDSPANHERNPAFPAISLEQFAAQVVTKFNVHNIEPHSRHFRSLDPAYLHG